MGLKRLSKVLFSINFWKNKQRKSAYPSVVIDPGMAVKLSVDASLGLIEDVKKIK